MCDPLPINWKGGKEPRGLPFHTPIAGFFLHAEQVCLLVEAIASRSARYLHHGQLGTAGGLWQGTHLVSGCMLSDYNNQGIRHSVSNSSRYKALSVYLPFVIGEAVLGVRS